MTIKAIFIRLVIVELLELSIFDTLLTVDETFCDEAEVVSNKDEFWLELEVFVAIFELLDVACVLLEELLELFTEFVFSVKFRSIP